MTRPRSEPEEKPVSRTASFSSARLLGIWSVVFGRGWLLIIVPLHNLPFTSEVMGYIRFPLWFSKCSSFILRHHGAMKRGLILAI